VGHFSGGDRRLFAPIVRSLLTRDEFLVLADYRGLRAGQEQAIARLLRGSKMAWTRRRSSTAARCGFFSSDRAMRQYAEEIWKVRPLIKRSVGSGWRGLHWIDYEMRRWPELSRSCCVSALIVWHATWAHSK
jgi:hypothetical protein